MGAKIPQDVTREDKLIGPLTLKQFLYILGGASITFILYRYYAIQYLYFIEFLGLSVLIDGLALALAFARVNGRPFGVFLLSMFNFILADKNRAWHKEPRKLVAAIKVQATDLKDTKSEVQDRKAGKQLKMQIEHLASILDTGGTMKEHQEEVMSGDINTFSTNTPAAVIEPTDVEDVLAKFD